MTPARPRSRHRLNAAMARIKLRGFGAIDRRTAAARQAFAFRAELVAALGGEADLSPQRRRLIDLAVRSSLLVDHVDAWLFEQQSLVNQRTRTLLPVLVQRQALAEHLAKLLDRLGLDRVAQKVKSLEEYLAERAAEREETPPRSTNGADEHSAPSGAADVVNAGVSAAHAPGSSTPDDEESVPEVTF